MKCDQDLCFNLRYDLKNLLWQDELNPRVRCAFGNVFILEGGMVACKEFPQIAAKLCCHSKRSFLLWEIFPGNIQINFLCFNNGAG